MIQAIYRDHWAAGGAAVKGGQKDVEVIEAEKLDLGMGGGTDVTPRKDD